jgi:nitrogen fixation protein NifU and related proteins
MSLYTPIILEHARHPRNFGRMAWPDIALEEVNPLCGDRIRIELRLGNDRVVKEARFSGEMCAIAKASASILVTSLEGMTMAGVAKITDSQVFENLGGPIQNKRSECALLAITALRAAIRSAGFGSG